MMGFSRYETERVPRPIGDRRNEGVIAVVLAIVAGWLLVMGFREISSSDAQPFYYYGALVMTGACFGGYRALFAKTRKQLSPVGLLEKQKREAQSNIASDLRSEKIDAHLDRWYVRYPVGIALLAVVWGLAFRSSSIWTGDFTKDLVWYAVSAFALCYATWLTREVSKWVIGLGITWMVVQWVSNSVHELSIPAAIIAGACIIAYAVYASRSK